MTENERQNERRCKGVIVNPKHPELGRPCKLWAVHGSDFCNLHGGGRYLGGARAAPESFEHRCIARSKRTGSRCKRPALKGMNVCKTHGGYSPQARKAARERLDALAEPAIHQLTKILNDPDTPATVRLKSIQEVLDRTGFGKRESLEVEVEVKPWEVVMGRIVKELPEGMQVDSIGPSTEQDVIDAELVEEDYNPRDALPQIRPNSGPGGRAAIHLPTVGGSAEPPRRTRDR